MTNRGLTESKSYRIARHVVLILKATNVMMVKSDQRLLRIIEGLADNGPVGVTELAEDLDMNPSTVHKHLKTLENEKYVVKHKNDYELGFKFLTHGCRIRRRNELCQIAKEEVKKLADEVDLMVSFSILEGIRGIIVYIRNDQFGLSLTSGVGTPFSLHLNSSGKSMLAELSDKEVNNILDSIDLFEHTQYTITSKSRLWEDIKACRERGYAINREENREGVNGVAAGVRHPDLDMTGSLALAGPKVRLSEDNIEREYGDILLESVNNIEIQIHHGT